MTQMGIGHLLSKDRAEVQLCVPEIVGKIKRATLGLYVPV